MKLFIKKASGFIMNLFLLFAGLLFVSTLLVGCLESTSSATPVPCDDETNTTTITPTPSPLPGATANASVVVNSSGSCSI